MEKEIILRRLVIKAFHIEEVALGDKLSINDKKLVLDEKIAKDICKNEDLIENININIIPPRNHDIYVNSIMDIIPISTKVLGNLGEGITHTLTGVYVMLTGADVDKVQMAEFGSSEGILREKLKLNKAGTPGENDYIIHFDVTLKSGAMSSREYPLAAHRACDLFIQKIRDELKKLEAKYADSVHEYFDKIRPNGKKVLIIKQVAGQGTMYDNMLLPSEPSGFAGGKSIIDIGNVPIILSPNEYRDGAIRAMT
ncbi:D-proline reductase (dithiol) PrdD [Alkalithermobacter thermoalcaliphilus JW-YL-7 = DSM 7308]|uniref:D-proline reductase (Dithiol) n=1 Tax=Alkalithermobacter thermoalcaliphilus JW-YL-7 = DSM 7308 TaxID=1121328 RepID=A0A150FRR4_CLOPD|nr:D-proline reductase (dithiol) [[Clostridium] paradoxum JW-YL-7 = DSM 7308]SHK39583.1 D-proline reductase (dithiol) PrdD [[Clostridium] paradoxum JW-YL-7 = DSM 7308]